MAVGLGLLSVPEPKSSGQPPGPVVLPVLLTHLVESFAGTLLPPGGPPAENLCAEAGAGPLHFAFSHRFPHLL